jgi:hypothetical protein
MKAPNPKRAVAAQTPVFPQTLHRLRTIPKADAANPKSKKRGKIFSKSRDTREDRGIREMKTKNKSQTLFQSCALL